MQRKIKSKLKYQVGDFVVDLNASLVIDPNGEEHLLKKKALCTLLVFLENPGKYLSNEVLIEQIYDNVSITTSNVAQNVGQLRKAFHDQNNKEIFVNRNKVGYRLNLPVSELQEKQTPEAKKWLSPRLLLALPLFMLAVIFLVYQFSSQPAIQVEHSFEQRPLTSLKGQERYPSLSRDRQWLVFSHRKEDHPWSLYARKMNSEQLIPLLSDPPYSYKHGTMSSDGSKLMFTRLSDGRCELMEALFDRKTARVTQQKTLLNCNASSKGSRLIEGISDNQLIYSNSFAIDQPYALYSFSRVNQHSEQLTAPPGTGRGDYFMALSPDKQKLAILRNTQRYVTQIRILDLRTRDDVVIDEVKTTIFSLDWNANGDSLIYKNATNQIVSMNLNSHEKSIIKHARFPFYAPISLDESTNRLAVIGGSLSDLDIVLMNLDTAETKPVIDSSYSDTLPVYSSRTKRLAWISNQTGIFQLWLQDEKSGVRKLTDFKHNGRFTSLDFSADGEKIGGTYKGQWFIYNLKTDSISWSADISKRYDNFAWRTDNSSAYILQIDHEGARMKVLNFSEGKIIQDSDFVNAHQIKLSPNGNWLFAWYKNSHRLIRYNLENKESFEISSSNQTANVNHWAISNQDFIWVDHTAEGTSFLKRLPHDEKQSSLLNAKPFNGFITLSGEESSIIVTTVSFGSTELIEI